MDEILSVFNAYKKRVFKGIRAEVEANLEMSYEYEKENWDALSKEEQDEWKPLEIGDDGGYGIWWYEWIDSPYDGAHEYINELWDRYWSNDQVLNQTLEAEVGLDPKTVHDEVEILVFQIMREVAGIISENTITEQLVFDFINWPVDNPKELI